MFFIVSTLKCLVFLENKFDLHVFLLQPYCIFEPPSNLILKKFRPSRSVHAHYCYILHRANNRSTQIFAVHQPSLGDCYDINGPRQDMETVSRRQSCTGDLRSRSVSKLGTLSHAMKYFDLSTLDIRFPGVVYLQGAFILARNKALSATIFLPSLTFWYPRYHLQARVALFVGAATVVILSLWTTVWHRSDLDFVRQGRFLGYWLMP